jgi:nascent polypeptide-associated complex subunit alpha
MVSEQTPATMEPEVESGVAAPVVEAEEPKDDGAPVVEDVKEDDVDEDEEEDEDDDEDDDDDAEDGNHLPIRLLFVVFLSSLGSVAL